ncbi:MAG TPA: hypothetical protein PKN13_11370, partial [Accumulibacter sp.]|nr:hypothetical protein [Accumulibacter sp.]
ASQPSSGDGDKPAAATPSAAEGKSTVTPPPPPPPAKPVRQSGRRGAKNTAASKPAATEPAVAEKAAEPAPTGKIGPGMNARGEVIDSSKVEAGYGQKVKGIRDWEGEITGRPAPNSKFTRLQIGMPMKQVTDLVGPPSDQGAYVTGKAFIPFFFGADKHRQELVYKNQGRLIFAGGSMGDFSSAHLVWIIHNANEPAYR